MAPRSLSAILNTNTAAGGKARSGCSGGGRGALGGRRETTSRARLGRREPAGLPAAADRPVLHLRLTLPGQGSARGDRHCGRRGDGFRHRGASLDPRVPASARMAGAAASVLPPARCRNRDGNPVDCCGKAAPPQDAGRRHRSGRRRCCAPERWPQRCCRPRADPPGGGIPQSAIQKIRLRLGAVEYPGSPVGRDGGRSGARLGAGRAGRSVGVAAPSGADRARPAPRLRHRPRTPDRHRRMVDPGDAPAGIGNEGTSPLPRGRFGGKAAQASFRRANWARVENASGGEDDPGIWTPSIRPPICER